MTSNVVLPHSEQTDFQEDATQLTSGGQPVYTELTLPGSKTEFTTNRFSLKNYQRIYIKKKKTESWRKNWGTRRNSKQIDNKHIDKYQINSLNTDNA